ncbi:MAG: tetratricopeptide repeat protein, partial [Rivularia sp. (in: cyanobacteria)]
MEKNRWNSGLKNTLPLHISTELINTELEDDKNIQGNQDAQTQESFREQESFEASQLLEQGIQHQQAGEFNAAIKSLQHSLALFQAYGNSPKQAQALSCLALVAYCSGDYKSVISYAEQCLSLARDTHEQRLQVQALSHLG